MIKSSLVVLMVWICVVSHAQQLPLFTQYRENIGIINPAAVHSDFLIYNQPISLGISYRKQWADLENAPQTQVLRADIIRAYSGNSFAPIFGGYLINDQTGPIGVTGINGKIGAVMSADPEDYGFSAALSAGAAVYHVDAAKIKVRDNGDISVSNRQNKIMPDVGLGVYAWKVMNTNGFFDEDILAGGISVPQVLGLNTAFKDTDGKISLKRVQHFYGQASFIHKFDDGDKFLEPSVWIKYAANAPLNVDINLRYQLMPNIWVGSGASTAGNFHAETGFIVGEDAGLDGLIKIGYGFDYTFSAAGPFYGSTHEFNLTYSFGGK